MATKTLSGMLESSRMLIVNSRDAEISPLLSGFGIGDDYLRIGEILYKETMLLVSQQSKEYQEQSLAYDRYHVQRELVDSDYEHTFKLVEILSKTDTDLQNRLKLHLKMPDRIENWINLAIEQYERLLNEADFLTKLSRFKLTTEVLGAQKTALEQLRDLRNQANIEKGEAQAATQKRNVKLEELQDYTRELKELSKLAIGPQSQLLEKLGIRVRSN